MIGIRGVADTLATAGGSKIRDSWGDGSIDAETDAVLDSCGVKLIDILGAAEGD